jgi:hypothetical protein
MKPVWIFLPMILLSVLACRKSGLQNAIIGNANDSSGLFSASIDGQPWIASVKFASIMNGAISISGTDPHNNALSITLGDTIIGPYSLGLKTVSIAEYTDSSMYLQEYSTYHSSAGGKVVVTAIDEVNKTITGNFTFNLYNDSARDQRTVTQGNFKNLPYVTELPPAKTTDTFYVQINGTDWNAKSISAGIVEGLMLVKGSEQDASRSVGISFPQYFTPGWTVSFTPFFVWGSYINGGQSYSSLRYAPLSNNLVSVHSYPGDFTVVEDNAVTRRLRANFQFYAATLTGSDSVQLSNGYFSVQY